MKNLLLNNNGKQINKNGKCLDKNFIKEDIWVAITHEKGLNVISLWGFEKWIIVRYHYTSVRMAKTRKTDNIKCWWRCRATGALICCWWECAIVQPLRKMFWQFLIKLNIHLLCDPAIPFLASYPREMKHIHKWLI